MEIISPNMMGLSFGLGIPNFGLTTNLLIPQDAYRYFPTRKIFKN